MHRSEATTVSKKKRHRESKSEKAIEASRHRMRDADGRFMRADGKPTPKKPRKPYVKRKGMLLDDSDATKRMRLRRENNVALAALIKNHPSLTPIGLREALLKFV